MSIRLDDKVVLLTGSTKGIGRTVALDMCRRGAKLVGSARSIEPVAELKKEIEDTGGTFEFIQADVSKWDDCQKSVEFALEKFGRLDILINNAALPRPLKRFEEITEQDWRTISGPTLDGVVFMCRAALPVMQKQGDGVIVNVASLAGVSAIERYASYAACKAAVIQLSKAIAVENIGKGVRCNAMVVGMVAAGGSPDRMTGFGRYIRQDDSWSAQPEDMQAAGKVLQPIMIPPEGVSDAIAVLCTPEAREINGSTISVDRGMSAGLGGSNFTYYATAGMIGE